MYNLENKLKQLIDARINTLSKIVNDKIVYIDNKASSGNIDVDNIKNSKYYNVIIDSDGGSINDDYVKVQGSIIEYPGIPNKNGYKFIDWFVGNDKCSFPITLNNKTIIVAKWNENINYTLTFNTNGGVEIDSITAEVNTEIYLPTPTKEKNIFTGWFLEPECLTQVEDPIILTQDMTLYAGWQEGILTIYASDLNTRYVKFRGTKTTNDWYVHFSEIEVYSNGVNVALGKKARKSASDGSFIDTVATNGEYSHYNSGSSIVGCDYAQVNNWFTIDLGQGYNVDTIKFFGMDMVLDTNVMEGVELQISEDDNNWYFIEKCDLTLNKVTDDSQHTPKEYDLTSVVIRDLNKQYLSDIPVRYIKSKIESETRGFKYSVLEVEAFSDGVNVALGKPAKMRNEAYQQPNLATDGVFHNTPCFTLNFNEWMTIDLQELYKLDNIHYYYFDTYGANASSFGWNNHEVQVSPDGETWYLVRKSNEALVNKTAGWPRDYVNYNLTTVEVE